MQCQICFNRLAEVIVEMHYVWSNNNPEVIWHVCQECWEREIDNPSSLGVRRDRRIIAKRINQGIYQNAV